MLGHFNPNDHLKLNSADLDSGLAELLENS